MKMNLDFKIESNNRYKIQQRRLNILVCIIDAPKK